MFPILVLACCSLSLPCLYLAYRLIKKRFLGSIFNQQAAAILILSGILQIFQKIKHFNQPRYYLTTTNYNQGITLPLSMAASISRLMSGYSFSLQNPFLCSLLSHLELSWFKLVDFGVAVSVIFR